MISSRVLTTLIAQYDFLCFLLFSYLLDYLLDSRRLQYFIIIIIIIHSLIRVTLSQKYATGALYKVNDAFTVTVQMLAYMSGHHQRMP